MLNLKYLMHFWSQMQLNHGNVAGVEVDGVTLVIRFIRLLKKYQGLTNEISRIGSWSKITEPNQAFRIIISFIIKVRKFNSSDNNHFTFYLFCSTESCRHRTISILRLQFRLTVLKCITAISCFSRNSKIRKLNKCFGL